MNTETIHPRLTLVGAGPGDPEMISLKALKALSAADVVLYDALVDPSLLAYCRKDARCRFVGKRAGRHSLQQDEINRLIVAHSLEPCHVVRLKGGDPFVFGRGWEEAAFARSYGIEVEVIPGISSSYAVPSLSGIPLTARGCSDSFWVLTATTRDGLFNQDIRQAAGSQATVVILMGMHKLREISLAYQLAGRPESPAAILQNGSLSNQKMAFGAVSELQALAGEHGLGSPAIIVIGEVVRESAGYKQIIKNKEPWMEINYSQFF
jgi:uroporphyrin-III C-methyltransferase